MALHTALPSLTCWCEAAWHEQARALPRELHEHEGVDGVDGCLRLRPAKVAVEVEDLGDLRLRERAGCAVTAAAAGCGTTIVAECDTVVVATGAACRARHCDSCRCGEAASGSAVRPAAISAGASCQTATTTVTSASAAAAAAAGAHHLLQCGHFLAKARLVSGCEARGCESGRACDVATQAVAS